MKTCPVCTRDQTDGLLCSRSARNRSDEGCTEHLERQLADVPNLIDELNTTISRQTRIDGTTTTETRPQRAEDETVASGLVHERLLPHMGAIQAADDLAQALTHWARNITGYTWKPAQHLGNPTADAAAALLAADSIQAIRRRPDVLEIVEGITDAIYAARRMTDQPAVRRVDVGPCPETDCPGIVQAHVPTDADKAAWAQCKANKDHAWSSIQFFRLGERIKRKTDAQNGTAA